MSDAESADRRRFASSIDARAYIEAVPLVLVVAALVWLIADDGGFETTTWSAAALFVVVVAATVALGAPRLLTLSRPAALAAASLFAFAAWSYLSIAWADDQGVAWTAANLTLFYATIFALLAARPVGHRTIVLVLTALSAAIAIIAIAVLWRASRSDQATADAFLYGRLSSPTGYPNATASLFAIGFWLSLGLALYRGAPRWARSITLGFAGIDLGACLMAESRGWAYTTPLVVVAFLAVYPRRLQALIGLAVVAATVAAASGVLFGVFRAPDELQRHEAERALAALCVVGVLLAVAGALLPLADNLRVPRRVSMALLVAAGVVVLGVCVAVVATADPVARVRSGWAQFKNEHNASGLESRFGGLGSNRYDFWRVGLEEFRSAPLTGIGADNFANPYVAKRRGSEQPLYPHSLWVRTLSQTGLVGSAMLLVAIVAGLFAVLRNRAGPEGPLGVALGTAFFAWLLHAQGDWLWEMPVLGATAFALLGFGAALGGRERRTIGIPSRTAATIVVAVVSVVAVLAIGAPWLEARYEAEATRSWRAEPGSALELLNRAASVNPLTDRPLVLAGAIASRTGDYETMRARFTEAVERTPGSWYSHLELAVACALTGHGKRARAEIAIAERLNPGDDILRDVAATIRAGKRPNPDAIDAEYAEQAERITRG